MSSTVAQPSNKQPFCTACGEVGALNADALLAGKQEIIDSLHHALAKEQATTKGLKAALAERREQNPHMADAKELFEHWRTVCGHEATKVFGEKRAELCLRQLQHFSQVTDDVLALFRRSIEGYSEFPDVGSKGRCRRGEGRRFDKFELIFRDETTVQNGLDLADRAAQERWEAQRPALEAAAREAIDHDLAEARRLPIIRVLDAIAAAEIDFTADPRSSEKGSFPCPVETFGDEPHESVVLLEEEDSLVRLQCLDGCPAFEVASALGLDLWLMADSERWGRMPELRPEATVTELHPQPVQAVAA